MRSQFFIPIFLAGAFGLVGCQSGITNIPVSPDSETGQAIRRMDYMAAHGGIKPEDEPDYRAKAMEFVRYAQAGNVDEMLKITSPQSYASQTNSLRSLYAGQVIPLFKHTDVTWNARCWSDKDEQKNVVLRFIGTAHGATTFSGATTYSFDVAVAKENGVLYVVNIH